LIFILAYSLIYGCYCFAVYPLVIWVKKVNYCTQFLLRTALEDFHAIKPLLLMFCINI